MLDAATVETLHQLICERGQGFEACRRLAEATDTEVAEVVATILDDLCTPLPGALYATGSYGKRWLAPRSDLDLLLLYDEGVPRDVLGAWVKALKSRLRERGHKVAIASRTYDECERLANEDLSIGASMLDARLILPGAQGGVPLAALTRSWLRRNAAVFADAVRTGCRLRHENSGRTVYLLEPNIKTGRGGLRDLQALFWASSVLHDADSFEALARPTGASPDLIAEFRDAADVLLRVRFALHMASKRYANDRLTFEMQERLAAHFGYGTTPEADGRLLHPVESFLRAFYTAADTIATWCMSWQDIWLLPKERYEPVAVGDGLCIRQGLVDFNRQNEAPAQDKIILSARAPSGEVEALSADVRISPLSALAAESLRDNPFEIFEMALEIGHKVHPVAYGHIAFTAQEPIRADARVSWARSMRRILTSSHSNHDIVSALSRLGLLQKVLPEFEVVTGLAIHDVYHVYTVDAHLFRCLDEGRRMLTGSVEREPDRVDSLAATIPSHRWDVLLLACLLHDVGKGRGEDHSVVGARMALAIGPRLGLTQLQTDHLAFLIRQHLLLPQVSQRKDLSDERTIREVALKVRTQRRLDDLTALAAADMRSVAPGNYSAWKAHLLEELHSRVSYVLSHGLEALGEQAVEERELRDWLRRELTQVGGADEAELFATQMPLHYLKLTSPKAQAADFVSFLEAADGVWIHFMEAQELNVTRVAIGASGASTVLPAIASALAMESLDILAASTETTAERSLNLFTIQTRQGRPLKDEKLKERVCQRVVAALAGHDVDELLRTGVQSRLPKRNSPAIEVKTTIDQESSSSHTIVVVRAKDQAGLLWRIVSAFQEAECVISQSKIVTEGARAIDSFYVQDARTGAKLSDSRAETLKVLLNREL